MNCNAALIVLLPPPNEMNIINLHLTNNGSMLRQLAEDEQEFSDDEAEMAAKASKKAAMKAEKKIGESVKSINTETISMDCIPSGYPSNKPRGPRKRSVVEIANNASSQSLIPMPASGGQHGWQVPSVHQLTHHSSQATSYPMVSSRGGNFRPARPAPFQNYPTSGQLQSGIYNIHTPTQQHHWQSHQSQQQYSNTHYQSNSRAYSQNTTATHQVTSPNISGQLQSYGSGFLVPSPADIPWAGKTH
jgi:hypothetical protein